jgi:DNA-binding transcriptional LysR family regulator
MTIETLELAVFTSVVRLESFAGTAEAHDMSASGVSRLIARLEEKLGVRLIQRTTRRLSLTEAGAAFRARASRILSAWRRRRRRRRRRRMRRPARCGPAARLGSALPSRSAAGIWARSSMTSSKPSPNWR